MASPEQPRDPSSASAIEVQHILLTMGTGFGPRRETPPELQWGVLFADLERWDGAYVEGLELIYEGYLLHYRESRVVALTESDAESALLAGDVFYAQGLRRIAQGGNVEAVGLLTRLMATCACLRTIGAPFAADDALWLATTAGLAASAGGTGIGSVVGLFDELDRRLAFGQGMDIGATAGGALVSLGLPDPAPALAALRSLPPGAALPPRPPERPGRSAPPPSPPSDRS